MSIKGYDNNLYCDVCDRKIPRYKEYMFVDNYEVNVCSEECLDNFIDNLISDLIMYCENS